MKTKFNKDSRNLLIAMLLGDGTISSNYVFKIAHAESQKDYLEWKIKQLNEYGIRNNGIKSYIKTKGFTTEVPVYYTQLNIVPFIKVLSRVVYKEKKILGNRKLLNRLTPMGVAIWYMDDGCININTSKQRNSIQYTIRIATCVREDIANVIINYFKETWNINMHIFNEGKNTFSIMTCAYEDTIKFVNIVKPYILQVPSLKYKIRNNFTKEQFLQLNSEEQDNHLLGD